jgi:hypothetical protein
VTGAPTGRLHLHIYFFDFRIAKPTAAAPSSDATNAKLLALPFPAQVNALQCSLWRKPAQSSTGATTGSSRTFLLSIFRVGQQAHLQADEAAVGSGSRLEHLKVLVNGNCVKDVLNKDATGTHHMHTLPPIGDLLATKQQAQLRRALKQFPVHAQRLVILAYDTRADQHA